jgi:hypothetical protein
MERMTQSITQPVTQALKLYVDQCMQDQEFAAQTRELEA